MTAPKPLNATLRRLSIQSALAARKTARDLAAFPQYAEQAKEMQRAAMRSARQYAKSSTGEPQ